MKIVHFSSGLGNQVFFHLFCLYLQDKYPSQKVYGYYSAKFLRKHNGLELDKVFDIQLPEHNIFSDSVAWLCRKLNAMGIKGLKVTDNNFSEKAVYFDGYYQDKKFFNTNLDKLRFKRFVLEKTNKDILCKIQQTQSISIHVRRGDYLQSQFASAYGGICTDEYYRKAIEIIKRKFENPCFFFFSDDLEWVKENLQIDNAVYVDNNKGANSYLDMYLMSQCKANIIANSSFSYWGAMMNKNIPMVIYPRKWNNKKTPDMFPEGWIGL